MGIQPPPFAFTRCTPLLDEPCRRTLQTQNQVSIMVLLGRGRTSGERAQGARLRASVRCTHAQAGTWGLTFEEVELFCSSSETPAKRVFKKFPCQAMGAARTYPAGLQGWRMGSTSHCFLRSLPDPRPVAQGSPDQSPPLGPPQIPFGTKPKI